MDFLKHTRAQLDEYAVEHDISIDGWSKMKVDAKRLALAFASQPALAKRAALKADAEAYKTTGSSGIDALITSNGITPYDGTSGGNAKGFTVGADAGMTNTANDVLYWFAWGKD